MAGFAQMRLEYIRAFATYSAALGACQLVDPRDALTSESAADAGALTDGPRPSDGGSDAAPWCASAVAPDPSLVAYYPFDEGQGLTLHDCSGQGNDALLSATLDAGSLWVPGHLGGAIAFNSAQSVCARVLNTSLNPTGDFTVAAWVKFATSVPATSTAFIVARRGASGNLGWRMAQTRATEVDLAVGAPSSDGGPGFNVSASTPPLTVGTWLHIAAVVKLGGQQAMYVNGGATAGVVAAPSAVTTDSPASVRIGCRAVDGDVFDGLIDEVRIYARALSAEDIAALAKL